MSEHHPYSEGDVVAITMLGTISDGMLRYTDAEGYPQHMDDRRFRDAADHYLVERPPTPENLEDGALFLDNDAYLWQKLNGRVRLILGSWGSAPNPNDTLPLSAGAIARPIRLAAVTAAS